VPKYIKPEVTMDVHGDEKHKMLRKIHHFQKWVGPLIGEVAHWVEPRNHTQNIKKSLIF
jgi:hypothetical protein